jgi:YVTN family beta-propeller protein
MIRKARLTLAVTLGVLAIGVTSAARAQPAVPVPPQAFVVNEGSGTVTPINLTTGTAGAAIAVGEEPGVIAALPDGKTVYVVNRYSGTVTPIDVATDTAGTPIKVGFNPDAIAITPNGKTVYVADNTGLNSLYPSVVVPIATAKGKAGKPIDVGRVPTQLAITPDGKTLLVLDNPFLQGPFLLQSVSTKTNKVTHSVTLPGNSDTVTIAPGGNVAYVAGAGGFTEVNGHAESNGVITPVTIPTMTEGTPITLGHDVYGGSLGPMAVLFSANGKWAYVVYEGVNGLDRVNLVTGHDAGKKIRLAYYPNSAVLSDDGKIAYVRSQDDLNVVDLSAGTNTVIPTSTWGAPGTPDPYLRDIALSPDGKTVYALVYGAKHGAVIPVSVESNKAGPAIAVGVKPVEMVIVP